MKMYEKLYVAEGGDGWDKTDTGAKGVTLRKDTWIMENNNYTITCLFELHMYFKTTCFKYLTLS